MNKKILLLTLISSSALFATTITGSVEGKNLTTTTLQKDSTTKVGQKISASLGLKEYNISVGTDIYSNITNKSEFSDKSKVVNVENYNPLSPSEANLWIKYNNTFSNGITLNGKATLDLVGKKTTLEGEILGDVSNGKLGENLKLEYTYGKDDAKLTSTTSYDTGNQISDKTSLNAKFVFDNIFRQANAGFNKFAVTLGAKTTAVENTTIESSLTATGYLTASDDGLKDLKLTKIVTKDGDKYTGPKANANVKFNVKANYEPETYYIKPSFDLVYYHLSGDAAPLGSVVTQKTAFEVGYTGIMDTVLSSKGTIESQHYIDSADSSKNSQNYYDLKLEPKVVMTHYKTDKISVGTEVDGKLEYNISKVYNGSDMKVSKFESSNVKLGLTPGLNITATPTTGLTITGNISVPFSLGIPFTADAGTNAATRGKLAPVASFDTTIGVKYVW